MKLSINRFKQDFRNHHAIELMAIPYRVACLFVTKKVGTVSDPFFSLAEACFRFAPEIAIREEEAIFLEVGRCHRLYTDQGLKLRLRALAERFGYHARVAVAESSCAALAQARYLTTEPGAHLKLPLSALSDFANPFIYDVDLQKKIREWIRTLILLGIKDVQDFSRLSPSCVESRFGKEALEIHAHVRGELRPAWPGFRPHEKIIEAIDMTPHPIQAPSLMSDALLFGLNPLVDRVAARLLARYERASSVRITLYFEKWSSLSSRKHDWLIDLPLSNGSSSAILAMIERRLNFDLGNTPLPAPVVKVEIEVLKTAPSLRSIKNGKEDYKWLI